MNSTDFDKLLRQVVVVPVAGLLLTAAILTWQILSFNRTVAQIQSSDRTLAGTVQLEAMVVDQESGLRGYQLTRDPDFLEPYRKSNDALQNQFVLLRSLESTPEDKEQVDTLKANYTAWDNEFALPLIGTVRRGGGTRGAELNLAGKRKMDTIRRQVAALTESAEARRDEHVQLWRKQIRSISIGLVMIALVAGLMIGLYVRRLLHLVSSAYRKSHHALRIRAEQTFRSEEKLRTTVESIGDGVITCDAEGRIQTMNTVARELTGWSTQEALHRPLEQVFYILNGATRELEESPFLKVKRLNRITGLANQTILIRRDGTELYIDDSGAPIRDKLGNLTGVVLVFRDITLAKKSRDALMANEKLAVAGRLAASIAHEIHNPLDSVSNLLYLMAGETTPEESVQFLELAQQEIARVTQISRAMLSLYREARTPVSIDLKEMFESVLLLMEGRFRTLGIRVSVDVPTGLAVRGFPAELRQVFTNLISNAAEATPRGSMIEIRTRAAEPGKTPDGLTRPAGVIVLIVDHGPGIQAEIRGELFKPFFTTKGENGTGLGLWISKGIITKHGGTIELASNTTLKESGTTATVFLANEPDFSAPAV